MFILGLTGGIGTGKSWVAQCFLRLGIPVYDADKAVHRSLSVNGKAVAKVLTVFPDVAATHGGIDRKKLGNIVFNDKVKLQKLEKIIHPLVRMEEKAFLNREARRGSPLVVLDIPLLYETGAQKRCDAVVVVVTSEKTRLERLLARDQHDAKTLTRIKAAQGNELEKRKKADFLIPNGLSRTTTLLQVKNLLNHLTMVKE